MRTILARKHLRVSHDLFKYWCSEHENYCICSVFHQKSNGETFIVSILIEFKFWATKHLARKYFSASHDLFKYWYSECENDCVCSVFHQESNGEFFSFWYLAVIEIIVFNVLAPKKVTWQSGKSWKCFFSFSDNQNFRVW